MGGTHLLGGKRQELTQKSALLAFVSSARSSHSDDAQLYIIHPQRVLGEHPEHTDQSSLREHSLAEL